MHESEIKYENERIKLAIPSGSGNIARVIKKGRFYEQKFLEYIRSLNIEGAYLDVGANIGNHTIFFAKFTKSNHVYSVEASPTIAETLRQNIKHNKLEQKVTVYEMIAGRKEGKASLLSVDSDQIGGATVIDGEDFPVRPIDTLGLENITAVKIDVEGYEMEVLEGMRKLIERDEPQLFIEVATNQHF